MEKGGGEKGEGQGKHNEPVTETVGTGKTRVAPVQAVPTSVTL